MTEFIKNIVIVGGGSAGWITAGVLAAEYKTDAEHGISITLVESPTIKTIGVGEGTWPTMQGTLKKIGLSETDFIKYCDASFKQGSKFIGWRNGQPDDSYYHPFSQPESFSDLNLVPFWQDYKDKTSFCNAVSPQGFIADNGLAPKQKATPEYAYVMNYGYHLDAGKFIEFLKKHCIEKLGVKYIQDEITQVNSDHDGYVKSVETIDHGPIYGDLFVDCSGFSSLLFGKHYDIPFLEKKDFLLVDTALAMQVPYNTENDPIASVTMSTARDAGWIWDIGLSSRRGVGYVYSSSHSSAASAESTLAQYIEASSNTKIDIENFRKISIKAGHREKFWHKNCVAIGLSAGFLEPLEASALVLIELSARALSSQLPKTRDTMLVTEKRFNQKFTYHWQRLIDFVKLHYVLNNKQGLPFWDDNRDISTIPDSLKELLDYWKYNYPWHSDFMSTEELFPAASYQFILYGMDFETHKCSIEKRISEKDKAIHAFKANSEKTQKYIQGLPTNRELINHILQFGLPAH